MRAFLGSVNAIGVNMQAGDGEKRSVCVFYLRLSELVQGRLHVSDITREAVKKECASQHRKGVRGAAGDARLRDANNSLRKKKKELTRLSVMGIDRAASCRLIGNRTVLHNKCRTPPHNWMES